MCDLQFVSNNAMIKWPLQTLFTAPLVSVRKALTRVKQEVTAMDVRIGVVEQKNLLSKLKDKSLLQKDMNAPVYNNMDMGLY